MSMFRFSRPVGSLKVHEYVRKNNIQIVGKEVHLGNHAPTDHYAPAIQSFIPAQELYDNQPRKRRR